MMICDVAADAKEKELPEAAATPHTTPLSLSSHVASYDGAGCERGQRRRQRRERAPGGAPGAGRGAWMDFRVWGGGGGGWMSCGTGAAARWVNGLGQVLRDAKTRERFPRRLGAYGFHAIFFPYLYNAGRPKSARPRRK